MRFVCDWVAILTQVAFMVDALRKLVSCYQLFKEDLCFGQHCSAAFCKWNASSYLWRISEVYHLNIQLSCDILVSLWKCNNHSFNLLYVVRQVHSLFQSEFCTQCNLVLPLPLYGVLYVTHMTNRGVIYGSYGYRRRGVSREYYTQVLYTKGTFLVIEWKTFDSVLTLEHQEWRIT